MSIYSQRYGPPPPSLFLSFSLLLHPSHPPPPFFPLLCVHICVTVLDSFFILLQDRIETFSYILCFVWRFFSALTLHMLKPSRSVLTQCSNPDLHGVQTVVMSGSQPEEGEGSSSHEDLDMDASPLLGVVTTSGAVVTHGTSSLPAMSSPVGAGGGTSILVSGGGGRGGAAAGGGVGSAAMLLRQQQIEGDGGQRGRSPKWSRLQLYKKHKKVPSHVASPYASCVTRHTHFPISLLWFVWVSLVSFSKLCS